MEWIQFVTLMTTIIGSVFAFYRMTREEIGVIREGLRLMGEHHKKDMQRMDEKMQRMDEKWSNAIERMDEKWERLFERLLIKDQK